MVEICKRNQCSGCGVCSSVCPHSAISMVEGDLGSMYPCVDQERCVDCGLCLKVCPAVSPVILNTPAKSYASYARSYDCRMSSASGGAASVLTGMIIENGGVVYGCTQGEGASVRHVRVETSEAAECLKSSKYVQSDMSSVLQSLIRDLTAGREVLFISVPCQVAGISNAVGLRPGLSDKLYTVDLCCHGTPPQKLLKEHLDFLGIASSTDKIIFREKTPSGIKYAFKVYDSKKNCIYAKSARKDFYMTGFLCGMFMRENCFSCRYACPERCSDLTLADHWAMADSSDPDMVASKGLSTILVNTSKGHVLFDRISRYINFEERPMREALRNGQFVNPSEKPAHYDDFVSCHDSDGYEMACRKFLPAYQRKMLRHEVKSRYYKCPLRQLIRKLLKK